MENKKQFLNEIANQASPFWPNSIKFILDLPENIDVSGKTYNELPSKQFIKDAWNFKKDICGHVCYSGSMKSLKTWSYVHLHLFNKSIEEVYEFADLLERKSKSLFEFNSFYQFIDDEETTIKIKFETNYIDFSDRTQDEFKSIYRCSKLLIEALEKFCNEERTYQC
jgi:hypothetical protein